MVTTIWSVRISAVNLTFGPRGTERVTVYDVGGAVRHKLKHTVFHARWVALGTAVAVALLTGYAQVEHGRIFDADCLDNVLKLGLLWAGMFLMASGFVAIISTERAGRRMTAMVRAAHGADRYIAVAQPTSLVLGFLGPTKPASREHAAGDVMLFTEKGWERLLASSRPTEQ